MGKKKEPVVPRIIVDTREQHPLLFSSLGPLTCESERATLSCADYSVAGYTDQIALERKSLGDLVQTLSHGRERFENELELLSGFRWKAILVEARQDEAEIGAYRSLMVPQAVTGSLDAIWMRFDVPTFWCGNAVGAARRVAWMAHRLHKRWPIASGIEPLGE